MIGFSPSDGRQYNATARTFYRRDGSSASVSVNTFGNASLFEYDGAGRKTKESQLLTASGKGDGTHIGRTTGGAPSTLPALDTAQAAAMAESIPPMTAMAESIPPMTMTRMAS